MKQYLLGLLFCWGCLSVQAQHNAYQLANAQHKVSIPFERYGNYILLNITLNNLPFRFILDSGSRYNLLTKPLKARLLGLAPDSKRFAVLGTDRQTLLQTYILRNISINIENAVLANTQAVLVPETDLMNFEETIGTSVDGILGTDLFKRFVVEVDYEHALLTLTEPAYFKAKKLKRYECLPLQIIADYPYLNCLMQFDNDTLTGRLLLDSGAGLSALLHLHPQDTARVTHAIPGNIAQGLGGQIKGYLGKLNHLQLSSQYSFTDITAGFQLPVRFDSVFVLPREGLIGNELLGRFHLVWNFADSCIYLKPQKTYFKPPAPDRSGTFWRAEGEGFHIFTLSQILKGSAADIAGLQIGDRLLRINKRKAKSLTLLKLSHFFSQPKGTVLHLLIERDGQQQSIDLILDDLF